MEKQFTMTINGTTWRVYNGSIEEDKVFVAEGRSKKLTLIREGGVYANKSGIRKAIMKLMEQGVEEAESVEPEVDKELEEVLENCVADAEATTEALVESIEETAQEERKTDREDMVQIMIRNLPKYVVNRIEDIGYIDGKYRVEIISGDVIITLENKNWNAFKAEVRQACK